METNDQQNLKNNQLLVAVSEGNLKKTEKLLEEGADINSVDCNGNTPLHIAVKKGYLDIVKLLLTNKVDINILNEENDTALDIIGRCRTTNNNRKITLEIQMFIIDQSFEILEEFVISQETLQQKKDKTLNNEDTATTNSIQENVVNEEPKDFVNRPEMLNMGSVTLNSANGFLKLGSKNLESTTEEEEVESEDLNISSEERNSSSETSDSGTVASSPESKDDKNESKTRNTVSEAISIINRDNIHFEFTVLICLRKRLNELKEVTQWGSASLTYREVNTFLLLLDGFSLIYLVAKNLDPNKNKSLENYLSNYYIEIKRDLEVILTMREVLPNNSSKKFTLEDISQFICLRTDKTTLFKKLSEYVEFLCSKVERVADSDLRMDLKSATILPSLLHRTNQDLLCIGTQSQDILKDELDNLMKALYAQEEWTQDRVHEILFSFLVNVCPGGISKGPSGLRNLREKVISKFRKYKQVPIMMKLEFERATFALRSILFKHFLAKEVYGIMYAVDTEEDINQLDDKLCNALHSVEMEFQENYKILAPKGQETSLEQNLFQSSVNSDHEYLALSEFVEHFFKFLIIIKAPKIEKQYQIQAPWGLYYLGEHFEKLMNLIKLKTLSPALYAKVKEELKKRITGYHQVPVSDFDEVCRFYLEDPNISGKETQIQIQITETISTVRRWRTRCSLSDQQTLTLYSCILDLKGNYDIDEIIECLKSLNIPESSAELFREELDKLYTMETLEIPLKESTIVRDTFTVISRIYYSFFVLYNSYNIKFNSIEEAFRDSSFRDNLLKLGNLDCHGSDQDKPEVLFSFLHKILLKLKYTAPYIARLIVEEGNVDIIEEKGLMDLTEILLEQGSSIYHLNDLLKVDSLGVDLYEIICDKINAKNLKYFIPIFQEPKQVTKILNQLRRYCAESEENNSAELKKDVLALLNKIAYDLYGAKFYQQALLILEIYNREMCGADELELLVAKRTEAMIKFSLGLQQIDSEEDSEENFISCLQILESIISTVDKLNNPTYEQRVTYFLSLVLMARTHSLLDNYVKSFTMFESFYQKIKLYTLGMVGLPSAAVATRKVNCRDILAIKESKMYIDLLDHSFIANKYLNIESLTYFMSLASKNEAIQCIKTSPLRALKYLTESLKIYEESYFVKKKLLPQRPDLSTALIANNISFAYHKFAILNFSFSPDVAFKYSVLGLKFSNEAYNIRKALLQDNELRYNAVKYIYYNISQVERCSRAMNDPKLKYELYNVRQSHQSDICQRFSFNIMNKKIHS